MPVTMVAVVMGRQPVRSKRRRRPRHKSSTRSNIRKYACGCIIQSSNRCNAFFVSLCDYHRGETNTTSATLEQLEDKMQGSVKS